MLEIQLDFDIEKIKETNDLTESIIFVIISTADEYSKEFETVFNEKEGIVTIYFCTMDKTLKELISKKLRMVELTKWEKKILNSKLNLLIIRHILKNRYEVIKLLKCIS